MAWERARRVAKPLAIIGCVSIGAVYVLVGILALLALAGVLTGSADEARMVHVVLDLPGGALAIWAIVLGLLGYVVWRGLEAVADPYDFGSDWRGMLQRSAIALSALGYGLVAVTTARIALSNGGGGREGGEDAQQLYVAEVLGWSGGPWLIGVAGVALLAMAVVQVVLAVRRRYAAEIRLDDCGTSTRRIIHGLAWYGYLARAAIVGVFGYFFIDSARRVDPSAVGDTDTAFDFIGGGAVGDTMFFVVALGTVAYGFFMFANARFYRFAARPDRERSQRG